MEINLKSSKRSPLESCINFLIIYLFILYWFLSGFRTSKDATEMFFYGINFHGIVSRSFQWNSESNVTLRKDSNDSCRHEKETLRSTNEVNWVVKLKRQNRRYFLPQSSRFFFSYELIAFLIGKGSQNGYFLCLWNSLDFMKLRKALRLQISYKHGQCVSANLKNGT